VSRVGEITNARLIAVGWRWLQGRTPADQHVDRRHTTNCETALSSTVWWPRSDSLRPIHTTLVFTTPHFFLNSWRHHTKTTPHFFWIRGKEVWCGHTTLLSIQFKRSVVWFKCGVVMNWAKTVVLWKQVWYELAKRLSFRGHHTTEHCRQLAD